MDLVSVSDELDREIERFCSRLETVSTAAARNGNYDRATEFALGAQAIRKWAEDDLEGAMDSISERNAESRYRPE
jgi:hypothetical protein